MAQVQHPVGQELFGASEDNPVAQNEAEVLNIGHADEVDRSERLEPSTDKVASDPKPSNQEIAERNPELHESISDIPQFPEPKIMHMESLDAGQINVAEPHTAPEPAPSPPVYSLEDRLRDANILKTKGNELYKQKNYDEAIKVYTESLSIAHPSLFSNCSQETMYKMAELNVTLLQNMAAAHYSIGNFDLAQKVASEVLLINPKHFKALYRRALCLYQLNRIEQAYSCIKDAYAIDQNVGEVNETYRKIVAAYKEEKEAKKKLYKSMFGNKEEPAASGEGSSELIPAGKETAAKSSWGFFAVAAISLAAIAGVVLVNRIKAK